MSAKCWPQQKLGRAEEPFSQRFIYEVPVVWSPTSSGHCFFALPYSNQWPAKQRRILRARLRRVRELGLLSN